jgi:hypothetical protein
MPCLQALGILGYKLPIVAMSETFHLTCHEKGQDHHMTHRLYLQSCLEMGSPYAVSYLQLGFTNVLFDNDLFRCFGYHNESFILIDKPSKATKEGYYTDDKCMMLLVLKKWLTNVYPTDELKSTSLSPATDVWNTIGLPNHQCLSSALVPPQRPSSTQKFTNGAYLQLLKCRLNLASHPFNFSDKLEGLEVVPFPVDRTLSITTCHSSFKQMISGTDVIPTDIRPLLFPSLVATVGGSKLDVFDAIASSMYLDGNLEKMTTQRLPLFCNVAISLA